MASHSKVRSAGELTHFNQFWLDISNLAKSGEYPACLETLDPDVAKGFAQEYLEFLEAISQSAAHVTDKMPYNFWNVGLIHSLLPDAQFVYCDRDPMDICLSIYFQGFSGYHPYACSFERLAHYFLLHRRLIQHWRRIGVPLHTVNYSKLLGDPRGQVSALLDYLQLPWEDDCLNFHKSPSRVATMSLWQVRQPLYRSSEGRWRNYTKYLAELRDRLEAETGTSESA